ncbi:MAG: hypothetical protein ACLPTZ_30790, partial [Beijerinckiaceae bacterium]
MTDYLLKRSKSIRPAIFSEPLSGSTVVGPQVGLSFDLISLKSRQPCELPVAQTALAAALSSSSMPVFSFWFPR